MDDLTAEKKKLRQMIRTQHKQGRETTSDLAQQQGKLFEVRMHGLSPAKRRELEYLLNNFATGVHSSVPSLTTSTSGASSG